MIQNDYIFIFHLPQNIMFAYGELKHRRPEPEEKMEGSEAIQFFKAKYKRSKGIRSYDIVVTNIFSKYEIVSGSKNISGSVLDVGCGYGDLIRYLHHTKPELDLVGIDASKTLLDVAKRLFKSQNIRFFLEHADKMHFKDNTFDIVVCKDTFHHFSNPVKILKEMHRVAKKDSMIYITDLKRDSDKKIILSVINDISKDNLTHAAYYINSIKASYTIIEMKRLFKTAGIKNYEIYDFKSDKKIISLIKTVADKKRRHSLSDFIDDRWTAVIRK